MSHTVVFWKQFGLFWWVLKKFHILLAEYSCDINHLILLSIIYRSILQQDIISVSFLSTLQQVHFLPLLYMCTYYIGGGVRWAIWTPISSLKCTREKPEVAQGRILRKPQLLGKIVHLVVFETY